MLDTAQGLFLWVWRRGGRDRVWAEMSLCIRDAKGRCCLLAAPINRCSANCSHPPFFNRYKSKGKIMANQCKFCDIRIEKIKKLERKIARVRKLQHQYYRDTSTICGPKYVAENIAEALKTEKKH